MKDMQDEPRDLEVLDYAELEWHISGKEPDPNPSNRNWLWDHLTNPEFGEGQVELVQNVIIDMVEREMHYWGLYIDHRKQRIKEKRMAETSSETPTETPKPAKRPRGRPRKIKKEDQ